MRTLRVEPPLGSLCQRLAALMVKKFFPMSVPTPLVRLCAVPSVLPPVTREQRPAPPSALPLLRELQGALRLPLGLRPPHGTNRSAGGFWIQEAKQRVAAGSLCRSSPPGSAAPPWHPSYANPRQQMPSRARSVLRLEVLFPGGELFIPHLQAQPRCSPGPAASARAAAGLAERQLP